MSDELEERPGFIVIRVGTLMTGIDQDAFQTVLRDGALELFDKRRTATGKRARKHDDPAGIFLLDFRPIGIPPLDERKSVRQGLITQVMLVLLTTQRSIPARSWASSSFSMVSGLSPPPRRPPARSGG